MYQDPISIKEGMLKMKKITNSYQDYGQDNVLLSEALLNYTIILMGYFDITTLSLYLALYCFYQEIINFFTIYK